MQAIENNIFGFVYNDYKEYNVTPYVSTPGSVVYKIYKGIWHVLYMYSNGTWVGGA